MSDTPRSDAFARAGAYYKDGDYSSTDGKQIVQIDDCRQLERELSQANLALADTLKQFTATTRMLGFVDGYPDGPPYGGVVPQRAAQICKDLLTLRANLERLAARWDDMARYSSWSPTDCLPRDIRRVLAGETPPDTSIDWPPTPEQPK